MNLHTITQREDGLWNASVQFADGFAETIEGLYDFGDALAWTQMHNAYHCTTGRHF